MSLERIIGMSSGAMDAQSRRLALQLRIYLTLTLSADLPKQPTKQNESTLRRY